MIPYVACTSASVPWKGILAYPIVHRQMRRALVRRFPYQILYEIEIEEIIIYAIYHSARDPEAWKRRKDG